MSGDPQPLGQKQVLGLPFTSLDTPAPAKNDEVSLGAQPHEPPLTGWARHPQEALLGVSPTPNYLPSTQPPSFLGEWDTNSPFPFFRPRSLHGFSWMAEGLSPAQDGPLFCRRDEPHPQPTCCPEPRRAMRPFPSLGQRWSASQQGTVPPLPSPYTCPSLSTCSLASGGQTTTHSLTENRPSSLLPCSEPQQF